MTQIDGLMTRAEVKEYLGIGETTLCAWVNKRVLPRPVRFGRETCWWKESLDRSLKAMMTRAESKVRSA